MQSSVNAKQHRSQSSQIHTAIVSPSKIIFTVCFTTLLILPLIPGFRLQHHKLVSFMTFRGLYFWQRTSQLFLCRKSKKCVQSKIVSDTIFFVINKRANLIYFNRKYKFNMGGPEKETEFSDRNRKVGPSHNQMVSQTKIFLFKKFSSPCGNILHWTPCINVR